MQTEEQRNITEAEEMEDRSCELAAGLPELPEKVLAAVFADLCDRGRNCCILF